MNAKRKKDRGSWIVDRGLKKPFLQGERRRPAGCVTHLAGHLFM
jgi:hypothetical protein